MRKAHIATLAGAALALASCQSMGEVDTAIQENLPQTCALITNAHNAFAIIAATGNIREATVRKEAAAYAGVRVFCDNPETVTAANALVLVAGAYAVVTVALKEARTVEAKMETANR